MFISLYPSNPPIPTHLFYIEMFGSKASLLKSLLFLLSLISIWALSIQQKVRQEGIVVPGTNIDKCYCSSISLMICMHMGGNITHTAQRHGCWNEFVLVRRWHKRYQVVCYVDVKSKLICLIDCDIVFHFGMWKLMLKCLWLIWKS